MKLLGILLLALVLILVGGLLGGCSTVPETVTVPVVVEPVKVALPAACHAAERAKAVPVVKVPGGTPAQNVEHAYVATKRAMADNDAMSETCECWIAREVGTLSERTRLMGQCSKTKFTVEVPTT